LLFWAPGIVDPFRPDLLSWLVLAASGLVWLKLAGRTWHESATLTTDMLVARNVFGTRRLPLVDVTMVHFRRWGPLVISAAGPAAPSSGRHAGGRQVVVPAVKLGAAFWSGRRTDADDIADTIAAAAGLPPLPPREEIISRREARILLPIGAVLFVLAVVLGQAGQDSGGLVPSARQWVGKTLVALSIMLLFPAGLATLDRFLGRWRGRDPRPPGQAPEIP
jgi:hypothetical protein